MKRMLMAEQWNQFAEKVLPSTVSSFQRREMRRAFYAGAESILFRVIQAFAPDSEPTDGDLQIMEDLDQELKDFAQDVKEGKA
jgi:hypothetical protein